MKAGHCIPIARQDEISVRGAPPVAGFCRWRIGRRAGRVRHQAGMTCVIVLAESDVEIFEDSVKLF